MARKAAAATPEQAEALALEALAFLAEDGPRLGRFLALTGIEPADLRDAADAPETLLAVLDHLLSDESMLLVFTASKALPPETIATSRMVLARSAGLRDFDD